MKISIIVPVYQEEDHINTLIEQIQNKSDGIEHEIIVVDGDQTGSTLHHIKDSSVIKLISPKGRANQMNFGATKANNSILFFLHADSTLPQRCFADITNTLNSLGIIGGAFNLGIASNNLLLKCIAKCASRRSRLTRIPYGDQGFFIKKEIFENINGFSDIPLMEDIDIMQKLKRHHYSIKILHTILMTSPRRWEKQGIVYCSLRNIILSSLFYLGVDAEKLKKYY